MSRLGWLLGVTLTVGWTSAHADEARLALRPATLGQSLPDRVSERLLSWKIGGMGGLSPLGPFEVDRGGHSMMSSSFATGLPDLVAESARASERAISAHQELMLGTILSDSGLVLVIGSELVPVVALLSATSAGSLSSGLVAVSVGAVVGCVVVGAVLVIAGQYINHNGMQDAFEAVSMYNEDLVDGRLASSAASTSNGETPAAPPPLLISP